jgi:hypothetical protein
MTVIDAARPIEPWRSVQVRHEFQWLIVRLAHFFGDPVLADRWDHEQNVVIRGSAIVDCGKGTGQALRAGGLHDQRCRSQHF